MEQTEKWTATGPFFRFSQSLVLTIRIGHFGLPNSVDTMLAERARNRFATARTVAKRILRVNLDERLVLKTGGLFGADAETSP